MSEWVIIIRVSDGDSPFAHWRWMYENERFTGRWSEDADSGEIRLEKETTNKLGLFTWPSVTTVWIHEDNIKLMRVLECNQKES